MYIFSRLSIGLDASIISSTIPAIKKAIQIVHIKECIMFLYNIMKHIMLSHRCGRLNLKITASLEENGYYKNMRNNRQIDLKLEKNKMLLNGSGFIITDKKIANESSGLYIFQDHSKTRSTIIIFEDFDDISLFKTLLEAENNIDEVDYTLLDRQELLELCTENNINCILYPRGSFVTPSNIEL